VPTSRATRVTSESEAVELVHTMVLTGVLSVPDFALDVRVIFLDKSPFGDGLGPSASCRTGDVRLRHEIDVIGQVFPRCRPRLHIGLAAPSLPSDPSRPRG